MNPTLLQVLPRAPGSMDGVGDYALLLARALREQHEIDTVFLAHDTSGREVIESFPVLPLALHERSVNAKWSGIVLHYVNYGFQKRGIPFALVPYLKALRRQCGAALLIIFHELFATGPPWRSEFWLGGLQKTIARDLSRLADVRLVSCETTRRQLAQLTPNRNAHVQPVTSTWGEPRFCPVKLRERDPHRWVICGGTMLLERSVRSFLRAASTLPSDIAPSTLSVTGGRENASVRELVRAAKFEIEYLPAVAPEEASAIFSDAAFAWLDYFSSRRAPADVLLKSSTFAALCAHGVICVVPRATGSITINGDPLPVPFTPARLPPAAARGDLAVAIYEWYQGHAASAVLARVVAQQLQLL